MERDWKFDKDFLREKINEGESLLKYNDIDENKRLEIDSMLSNFYDYLGESHSYSSDKRPILSLENIYKSLTNKFKRDLDKLDLDCWVSMHDLCWKSEKPSLMTGNTHKLNLSDDKMVTNTLNFYKKLDKDFYVAAKKIITNPVSLINFSNRKSLGDHCFPCRYLDLPFINVYKENDLSAIWFVHELQHGIDYILYKDVPYFFSEASFIFSETLYIDSLVQKGVKIVDPNRFYSYRIHTNNENMQNLYNYVELLYRFIENGLEVNKDNVSKILICDSEKEINNKYNFLRVRNYLEMFGYILGFLKSLELREIYYNDRNIALSQLKNILMGGNDNVDFDMLEDCYSNYVSEIKAKYKMKRR